MLFQLFRGNLDNWDLALIDTLVRNRRIVTFDNAGVAGSGGTTPDNRPGSSPRQIKIYPDAAGGFLFQHHDHFADIEAFLR